EHRDQPAPAEQAEQADDPIGDQLLDAASRVFAREGYEGTKILDIVREARLSTGAIYSRFRSKNDLLRAAVIRSTAALGHAGEGARRLADVLAGSSVLRRGVLADSEAVRLEAYVTARREPEVAQALADAHDRWHEAMLPLVESARADGSLRADADPEAVLFLFRTLYLGVLLHRGSGLPGPDPEAWEALLHAINESLATRPPRDALKQRSTASSHRPSVRSTTSLTTVSEYRFRLVDTAGSELGIVTDDRPEITEGESIVSPEGTSSTVIEVYDDEDGREGDVVATLVVDDE
ncbi:MAG: TetR/AcrR family transcriptional regulator, partial [Acidimicrobiales bacterium]